MERNWRSNIQCWREVERKTKAKREKEKEREIIAVVTVSLYPRQPLEG